MTAYSCAWTCDLVWEEWLEIAGREGGKTRRTGFARWKDICINIFFSPFYFYLFPFRLPSQKDPILSGFSGHPFVCPSMTLIDMNTVHFYRPAEAVGQRKDGWPAVSSLRVSMAREKSDMPSTLGLDKGWSGNPQDCDLIEIVDMDGLSPEEPLNPFQGPASDFDSTVKHAEGTVLCGYF